MKKNIVIKTQMNARIYAKIEWNLRLFAFICVSKETYG